MRNHASKLDVSFQSGPVASSTPRDSFLERGDENLGTENTTIIKEWKLVVLRVEGVPAYDTTRLAMTTLHLHGNAKGRACSPSTRSVPSYSM